MATVEANERIVQVKGHVVLFRLTSDEFIDLPPGEDVKLELLNGEVIMSPRPTRDHQYFLCQLMLVLGLWLKGKKLGRLLPGTLMKLDDIWTPAPDLVFIAQKHLHRAGKNASKGRSISPSKFCRPRPRRSIV